MGINPNDIPNRIRSKIKDKSVHKELLKLDSEHDLQCRAIEWFRNEYPNLLLFAIPNGGHRHVSVAKKLKREGTVSGVWDLFLAAPKQNMGGCWIETKFKYNKLTDNQKKFREKLRKSYHFFVYYNMSEFKQNVENYLK